MQFKLIDISTRRDYSDLKKTLIEAVAETIKDEISLANAFSGGIAGSYFHMILL
jgi:hypothetical protein